MIAARSVRTMLDTAKLAIAALKTALKDFSDPMAASGGNALHRLPIGVAD